MSIGRDHHQARAEEQMAFSDNQTSMFTSQCPKITVLEGNSVQDLRGAEGGTPSLPKQLNIRGRVAPYLLLLNT